MFAFINLDATWLANIVLVKKNNGRPVDASTSATSIKHARKMNLHCLTLTCWLISLLGTQRSPLWTILVSIHDQSASG